MKTPKGLSRVLALLTAAFSYGPSWLPWRSELFRPASFLSPPLYYRDAGHALSRSYTKRGPGRAHRANKPRTFIGKDLSPNLRFKLGYMHRAEADRFVAAEPDPNERAKLAAILGYQRRRHLRYGVA